MIFCNVSIHTHCRRDSLLKGWANWISTCRGINIDYHYLPAIKSKSKRIKDTNVRPDIMRLLLENIE